MPRRLSASVWRCGLSLDMRHAYTPDPKMRHALLALCDLLNLLITFFIIILTFFIILTLYTAQSAGNVAALLLTFVRFDNGRHGPSHTPIVCHRWSLQG